MMGLFDKLTKKSIEKKKDKALTILMEGTSPIKTLENARASLFHFCYETGRYDLSSLYACLGDLCGIKLTESVNTTIDFVFCKNIT